MAGRIQRLSGPQPLREQPDGQFAWTIPLDGAPGREWITLFNTPEEADSVCMPSRVEFRDRGIVFTAPEEQIAKWVRHIDQWMTTANEGVVIAEARRTLARDREERGAEEARQRISDADRYRNL
jgi:hypothetical protein